MSRTLNQIVERRYIGRVGGQRLCRQLVNRLRL